MLILLTGRFCGAIMYLCRYFQINESKVMHVYKERRKWIGEQLSEKPFISLDELFSRFPEVSQMTLRRDLDYFEKRGEAIKVRGGARSAKFITEQADDPFTYRKNQNIRSKIGIAKQAVAFLEAGRSVFIDSGSTIQQMIPFIPNGYFTFTTTSPQTALELCRIGKPCVNLVGGRLDNDYQAVSGNQAMRFLSDVNIDIAFLCPSGLSAQCGFTGGKYSECELKRAVVEKARKVIMLMDISKTDKSLPYTFANLSDVDILICDGPLPENLAKMAENEGVQVITAE